MKTAVLSTALYAALSVAAPVPAASASDCKSYTLLFARGTTEMGTMGSVVGPSLSTKVKSALGENNVNVEGVQYAADAAGIMSESMGTGGAGTTAMTNLANSWLSKCPDTKLILTGYSQGAMLVHHTATKLGSKTSSVACAVTFGDPFKSQKLDGISASKFKTFCASGDSVCGTSLGGSSSGVSSGGDTSASTSGHLGYSADTGTAATFIKNAVGSSSRRELVGLEATATTLEARDPQFSLPSGTGSGLGGLTSALPSGLGSSTGGGLGGLTSGLPSLGGSGTGSGLGGLTSGLPSLSGSSGSGIGTSTLEARDPQFSSLGGLGSLGSGTGSLGSLSTPSFGSLGGSSGTSPFGSLSSLGSGSGLGSSLGGSSLGSGLGSSGLSGLSSGY
ncbi:cutinase-domain-containing protein [Phyllosticta capitalensis]|uniref:cutinase-domain-containing protein n=1 Tax=Phyllosticta capitalensis TaxID=121624 RepID=UPI003130617B